MALAAATGASALLFTATCCRTIYFGDSGELIAAAACLGVAHPPGYPLYTLLGRLALAVPLGEPALRMNLLSALFGALACGGVAALIARWTGRWPQATAAALILAVSDTFWEVATVAEVYTLHLLLIGLLWLLGDRLAQAVTPARIALAALCCGLGLAHRPTIVLALPGALILAWPALRRLPGRLWALGGLCATAPPLIFYGTLLLRARSAPLINWGNPSDLGSLWLHLSTRGYASYRRGIEGWLDADAWLFLNERLLGGSGYLALPLALLGCFFAFGRRTAAIASLALATILFGLSYGTEDVEVLFLPLSLAVALAAGVALSRLVDSRRWRPLGWLLTVSAVAVPLALHYPSHDLRRVTAAADYGTDLLAGAPRDGILFVEGDDAFILAYLLQVRGLRPDLTVYDRLGLVFPDALATPLAARSAGESSLAWRIRDERARISRELARPAGRAVVFMSWPGYASAPGWRFEPWGQLYRATANGSALEPPPTRYEQSVRTQAAIVGHAFGMTVAASYPLMRGERALFEGRRDAAFAAFDEAAEVAGDSETIHNLIGTIYGRIGELPLAVAAFERATEIKPTSFRAWNNLGLARSMSGDAAGARAAWRRSLNLEGAQPETRARLAALENR